MQELMNKKVNLFTIHNRQHSITGTIKGWDDMQEHLILEPQHMIIPFKHIAKLEVLEPITLPTVNELAWHATSQGVLRFVMHEPAQFENAIYFRSPVTVWQGDQLLCMNSRIDEHNQEHVRMENGATYRKADCTFIVQSNLNIYHGSC